MLGNATLVAFVSTSDPERAKAFYSDVLGLELIEQTPFACVFRTPNAELRVTVVADIVAAPYTVLGWRIADIEASVRKLAATGTAPLRYDGLEQDELGIWTSPTGARVVWFEDPDGNVLSMTQAYDHPDPSHSSR
jgi:catechol 2,3-dioxygenase-like lactoylglutathione lyase family enzyme